MLRRLAFGLSKPRSYVRSPAKRTTAQTPFFLSSRCASSSSPQPDPSKGSGGGLLAKAAIGTVVVGAAVAAAYQTGFVSDPQFKLEGPFISKKVEVSQRAAEKEYSQDQVNFSGKETSHGSSKLEVTENIHEHRQIDGAETIESDASKDLGLVEDELTPVKEDVSSSFHEDVPTQDEEGSVSEILSSSKELSDLKEEPVLVKEDESPISSLDVSPQSEEGSVSEISSVNSVDLAAGEINGSPGSNDATYAPTSAEETISNEVPTHHHQIPEEVAEDYVEHKAEVGPLSEMYSLEGEEERPEVPINRESPDTSVPLHENKEVSLEGSGEINVSQDQKIVLDFIDAIHAAEKKQAESDFRFFDMEKQKMKEKYEKELKDARARELMYAEEAAILDKELNRERVKAAATAKLLQEKAEEHLRVELQRKEEEIESMLKKIQEMGKAELNAAVAKEKSSHMEKMSEANLNIKVLCMAFYARSEEARQNYSIHKLALGALALENALSKGLPIKAEVDSLHSSLVGLDKDSLLDLVLATLPEETLTNGTNTLLQLSQKFEAMKGTLRHFSLIPPGGGGMLAHAVAHVASAIKMRESGTSGKGIESVISGVERLIAAGKLAEAADALERGVSGTEAEGAVNEWVRLARDRAITEQALTLLQAYATSISLT